MTPPFGVMCLLLFVFLAIACLLCGVALTLAAIFRSVMDKRREGYALSKELQKWSFDCLGGKGLDWRLLGLKERRMLADVYGRRCRILGCHLLGTLFLALAMSSAIVVKHFDPLLFPMAAMGFLATIFVRRWQLRTKSDWIRIAKTLEEGSAMHDEVCWRHMPRSPFMKPGGLRILYVALVSLSALGIAVMVLCCCYRGGGRWETLSRLMHDALEAVSRN